VETGQLGIFANAYWGHPAYKLPPEVNLIGVAHYLEALEWQKEMVKVHTIFGGKNPHPNYLVGGVPCALNIDEANAINAERLAYVGRLFEEGARFVEQVYLPDLLAVAPYYLDWTQIGAACPIISATATCRPTALPMWRASNSARRRPRTAISARSTPSIRAIRTAVQESIAHSWYTYRGGEDKALHPGPERRSSIIRSEAAV